MNPTHLPWIETGYHTFAYEGPHGLKVERLAKQTAKNKSSFYHHFGDLEVFTEELLNHHIAQTHVVAEKEAKSTSLADLIDVLVEHKIDLLFNRQLRIHRENPAFQACFLKTNELSIPGMLNVWAKIIGLTDHSYLAGLVLQLSMENFFLQITDETLNPTWLNEYFQRLQQMVREFKKTGTVPTLDGTV